MRKELALTHEFVEFIPDSIVKGTLYVSMEYATVVHKCCCGCGKEVVTPLSPTDWNLTFDGKAISLHPSIGNWSFPCRSHYWIRNNTVQWAEQWSQERIAAARAFDRRAKKRYFSEGDEEARLEMGEPMPARKESWWRKWWSR